MSPYNFGWRRLRKKITAEINFLNNVDVNRYPYLHIFDVPLGHCILENTVTCVFPSFFIVLSSKVTGVVGYDDDDHEDDDDDDETDYNDDDDDENQHK